MSGIVGKIADLAHLYGNDLKISASGDLMLAVGDACNQQRVLRRLLTNPTDDIWNIDYGAGLPRDVGAPVSSLQIAGTVRAQLRREAAVSTNPMPTVSVTTPDNGTVIASISYADAISGAPQILSFPIG